VVEVTETALMGDLQPAIAALSDLRDMGVRIAVDDFGTGYSSFSYLSTLPVDRIKIDKSFVDHIAKTADGYAMVRAVVDLTHTLGLQAIAEGVEHEEQASALRDIGCRFSQGYLFARPMPASDLATFIDPRFVAPNSSVSSEISRFRRVGDRASA